MPAKIEKADERLSYIIMVRFPEGQREVVKEAARQSGCKTPSEWVRKRCQDDIERILGTADPKPKYIETPF